MNFLSALENMIEDTNMYYAILQVPIEKKKHFIRATK